MPLLTRRPGGSPGLTGFFDSAPGLRSDAEEILEGVLLHAANAYQERKLRPSGSDTPGAGDSPRDPGRRWALDDPLGGLRPRLTWRQLVVLSLFANPPSKRFAKRDVDHDERGTRGPVGALRDEIEELGSLGLLGVTNTEGEIDRAGGTMGTMATIWGAPLGQWQLTQQGRLLVEVAKLDAVPKADQDLVLSELLV